MSPNYILEKPVYVIGLISLIVLIGAVSFFSISVKHYPDIAPPVVRIEASAEGMSPILVDKNVTSVIESSISGIQDTLYVKSSSTSDGQIIIDITLEIGSDVNTVISEVNNRIKYIESRLPKVTTQSGIRIYEMSNAFLQVIAFSSPDNSLSEEEIGAFIKLNVIDGLRRISGATGITVYGDKEIALRIWLDPNKLSSLAISTKDINNAILEHNTDIVSGKIGANNQSQSAPFTYTLIPPGSPRSVEEFERIIVRSSSDGKMVRLKDVAQVELANSNYLFKGTVNGTPTVLIGVFLDKKHSAIAVDSAITSYLDSLKNSYPAGIDHEVVFETSTYIRESISQALHTLIESIILVSLIVWLFIKSARAAMVPILAIPLSLLGTLIVLYTFGYTINLLTLYGIILSIGIVVDDAILMLENIIRLQREKKLALSEAVKQSTTHLLKPVFAVGAVLVFCYLPILFISGVSGEMYKNFTITFVSAVTISAVVSLYITPYLCLRILKSGASGFSHSEKNSNLSGWVIQVSHKWKYGIVVGYVLLLCVSLLIFSSLPKSFVPQEDLGYYMSFSQLENGASILRTSSVSNQISQIASEQDEIENVVIFSGMNMLEGGLKSNTAGIFVGLKHWDDRARDVDSLISEYNSEVNGRISEGFSFAFNPPAIPGLGAYGGFELILQSKKGDVEELGAVLKMVKTRLLQESNIQSVNTFFSLNNPQIKFEINREKAAILGVEISQISDTLQSLFSSYYVDDFFLKGKSWKVLVSAKSEYADDLYDLRNIVVHSRYGKQIFLVDLVDIRHDVGPEVINRFNGYVSAFIFGQSDPKKNSGSSIEAVSKILNEILPAGYTYSWSGTAYQENEASNNSKYLFIFSIILVVLVTYAIYETFVLPAVIFFTVPFYIFGSLLFAYFFGVQNNIYFEIGILTLIGLAAKNVIFLVDLSINNISSFDEITEAVRLALDKRMRPVVMTSIAFILGVIPLALSSGAGEASRVAVGIVVIGGMLFGTLLTLFVTPYILILVLQLKFRCCGSATPIKKEEIQ